MNDLKQQLSPSWSAVNIGLTVILFLIGWPLGLIMIAYIVFGQKLGLDLSRPETLGVFGNRLAQAWRAAIKTFKTPS